MVAERLTTEVSTLRGVGRAIPAMSARLRGGAAWFEAGVASFGDAALPRAIAIGAAFASDRERAMTAASIDAAVTHASPTATHAAAALAAITADLTAAPRQRDRAKLVADIADIVRNPVVADALRSAVQLGPVDPATAIIRFGREPVAHTTLGLAVWAMISGGNAVSLLAALAVSRRSPTLTAVTGGLLGAAFGVQAFPHHWRDHIDEQHEIRQVFSKQTRPRAVENGTSIWILLDRSGSMASISSDVEHGIDSFIGTQRHTETGSAANGNDTVTVVQFDSAALHDVVIDHTPIHAAPSMLGRFHPRGTTPLYDAIGTMLDTVESRGGTPTDQIIVVFTDGMENASRRWTQRTIFRRVECLREQGFTFVFLGANQDSYLEGRQLGLRDGNISNFTADADGVRAAYTGLARATSEWRRKPGSQRRHDIDDFWAGRKEGELR